MFLIYHLPLSPPYRTSFFKIIFRQFIEVKHEFLAFVDIFGNTRVGFVLSFRKVNQKAFLSFCNADFLGWSFSYTKLPNCWLHGNIPSPFAVSVLCLGSMESQFRELNQQKAFNFLFVSFDRLVSAFIVALS